MTNKDMIKPDHWKSASTAPEFTGNSVHIWKLSLLNNNEVISGDILSKDEIQKAERFRFEVDRNKFVLTRTILRSLLSRYTDVDAKELTFSYNKHGKPYLLNPNKNKSVFFNITYSKDIALFAFTRQCEIGIDIEYMRDNVKCLKLAQRFFSEQEYQALAQLSGNELKMGFYRCWTRKEAFIKAVGTGLSFSLSKFAVNLDKDDNPKLLWADKTHFHGTCNMFPILHDEHYFASLACLCDFEHIDFYHCPQDLTEAN
jgi:4'-phosphopantetheinyl transferase